MNRWLGGFWLVGVVAVLLFGACAPITSDVGSLDESGGQGGDGGSMNGSVAGSTNEPDPECTPGTSRPAGDGCNTCSCSEDGLWLCTEIGCAGCTPGTSRPAGDGCNTCSCSEDGLWLCTEIGCAGCTPGTSRPAGDGCNTCSCSEDGLWLCTEIGCSCEDGATRPAGDGCNTCECREGSWGCTMVDCPTPACTPGETQFDGCTSCVCRDLAEGPTWTCTLNECPELPCEMGRADCDGVAANGCETDIANSALNCGACGNYCSMPGASSTCKAGVCEFDDCVSPYDDCNGDPADGCEVPVGSGGCEGRCDAAEDAPEPSEPTDFCDCPEGTACVIGSTENEDGEYCFPLPEACDGNASCSCLGTCVCPDDPTTYCREEMSAGVRHMVIHCNSDL